MVRGRTRLRVYFNAANIEPYMSLGGTCLNNGEVWTFLTNKNGHGGRGTLATAIPGTKSDQIHIDIRRQLIAEENNRDKSVSTVTYSRPCARYLPAASTP